MALTPDQQKRVDHLRANNLFAAATQAEQKYNQQNGTSGGGMARPSAPYQAPQSAPGMPIAGPTFVSSPTGMNPNEVIPGSTKPTVQGAGGDSAQSQNNKGAIDLFNAYRPQLGQPTDNVSAGVETQLSAMKPGNIQELPQEYWNNQRQNAVDNLNQQFFGPLGTAQQAASQESAMGRLGSGVGKRVIQETVTQPFAQANLQNERDIQNLQYQNKFQVASTNQAQNQSWNQFAMDTISKVRSGDQAMRADAAKRLDDLSMGLVSGQIHMDEAQANQMIALMDEQLKANQQAQEMANTPINPGDPSLESYWLSLSPEQLHEQAVAMPGYQMFFDDKAAQVRKMRGA